MLEELRDADGLLSMPTREWLAAEAFAYTARYDTAISRWFAEKGDDFPSLHLRAFEKVLDLPYGENPHQRAAYYAQVGARAGVLSQVRQHHGKQISFNNILDLDAARTLLRDLGDRPACVIVKHNNPCGAAVAATLAEAYRGAFECDPMSAFGGVIAVNRPVDRETAEGLSAQFVELLFAPGYDEGALDVLTAKPDVRLLEDQERRIPLLGEKDVRQVTGGLLVQDRDTVVADRAAMEVVTGRPPTEEEWADLVFAWDVCKHVRSNAIVLARGGATVGIGAGQMSRVDSVRLAVEKCRLEDLTGAVMASDAFFPFADGPQLAIEAGVGAIIQPGGSKRDDEVVAAADAAGVAWSSPAAGTSATDGSGRAPRLRRRLGGRRRLLARGPRGRSRARRGHDGDDGRRRDRRPRRSLRADVADDREHRIRARARGRDAGRRRPHARLPHRRRPLGGLRPRARRDVRRHPAGQHDGHHRRPRRPADARRDRGRRVPAGARAERRGPVRPARPAPCPARARRRRHIVRRAAGVAAAGARGDARVVARSRSCSPPRPARARRARRSSSPASSCARVPSPASSSSARRRR